MLAVALALAGNAKAGPLQPIDPRNVTIINSAVVPMSTLDMNTIATPMVGVGIVPQSRSLFGTRTVETKTRDTRTVETSTIDRKVLPPVVHDTKRAEVADRIHPTTTVAPKAAPIPGRVIRVFTQDGMEELKTQLHKTP